MSADTLRGTAASSAQTTQDVRLIAGWTDLGQAVRSARLSLNLTQSQLADRAGVSRAWLARVEKGHRKAELEQLMRTLDALGLSFSLSPTPITEDEDPELDEALRVAGLT